VHPSGTRLARPNGERLHLGDGTHTGIIVAARAASTALPIASEGRQRALAAGLLRCDELLAGFGEQPSSAGRSMIRRALDETPGATGWARDFLTAAGALHPRSVPLMSDAIIRTAVVGIADACVTDPDARLRWLLTTTIADCTVPSRANREEFQPAL
jgi:hypothetical protein